MANFQLGSTFPSFEAFNAALHKLCKETSTVFVRRDMRKIKDQSLLHLEFEGATYVCKHGKQIHVSVACKRPNQRSFKTGCEASFRIACVRPAEGAAHLRLTKVNLSHSGHEINPQIYSVYPENRRVTVTKELELLAQTSMKRSELRTYIENSTGVPVNNTDVSNMKAKIKKRTTDSLAVDEYLKEISDKGGKCFFSTSEDNSFQILAFQTSQMLGILNQYPETLILDFKYKTNKYLLPLLTIMAIDNCGHGLPALHSFVKSERSEKLADILEFFKETYVRGHKMLYNRQRFC